MMGVNPTRKPHLYVDPNSAAAQAAKRWSSADAEGARLLRAYAAQPSCDWIGDWTNDVAGTVKKLLDVTGVRVLVLYNIPDRDLGSHSAGGVADATAYLAWVGSVASSIKTSGKHPIVIVEPDALAMADGMSDDGETARYAMIGDAVRALKAAGARVFIDCGDSHWVAPDKTVDRLIKSGVVDGNGFSSNVAHHETDADEQAWCASLVKTIEARTGRRKRFVIDTGRNGRGPYRKQPGDTEPDWCNSPGIGVGQIPTLAPIGVDGKPLADCAGFFWVKGLSSDGPCRGYPAAGAWSDKLARERCANAVPPL